MQDLDKIRSVALQAIDDLKRSENDDGGEIKRIIDILDEVAGEAEDVMYDLISIMEKRERRGSKP